jgi:ribonuclease H2 subunit B
VLENLKGKVGRLSDPRVAEMSRTLVRSLAKDGLMDDGKEELLECASFSFSTAYFWLTYFFSVGRIKLACELLSQYLPRDVLQDLIASYEYVSSLLRLADINRSSVSPN